MANNFNSATTFVARTMTEFFTQKSPLLNTANRNYVEQFSSNSQYVTGGTINIKVPGYKNVTRGLDVTPSDIDGKIVPYTIGENDMYNVSDKLSLLEEHFEVVGGRAALTDKGKEAVVDNYCKPIFLSLEGDLETEAAARMQAAAYMTPIDEPSKLGQINSYSNISEVEELMTDMKFGMERYAVMNPHDSRQVFDSMQTMFNPVINTKITESARLGGPGKGRLASFDMYTCADISRHYVGEQYAFSPSFTVSQVANDGSTITFDNVHGVTSRLIKKGDRISIPSVNLLDPITKTTRKWKLVVCAAADASGDGNGHVTVTLSEPLAASGMHANVSALPAVGASAELFPDHNLNYFYVPSGLSAVPLPLGDISGADNSQSTLKSGQVPVKTVVQGNVDAFTNTFRNSILCGIKAFAGYIVVLPSSL